MTPGPGLRTVSAAFPGISLGSSPVTSFSGPYRFLSNPYPCQVAFEGVVFPSAEHAFQAAKTVDWALRFEISAIPGWREAKSRGRSLQLRHDWEQVRRAVMLQVVLAKFLLNDDLRRQLTATGQRMLLEGNAWGDTDWGAVPDGHPRWSARLPWWHYLDQTWAGHNWLGWSLMMAREVLTEES